MHKCLTVLYQTTQALSSETVWSHLLARSFFVSIVPLRVGFLGIQMKRSVIDYCSDLNGIHHNVFVPELFVKEAE